MKIKFLSVVSIFSLFLSAYANAQVVAISCIESEHAEKTPSDVTLYFENNLLGSLFDEGLIVTSLPYKKASLQDFNKSSVKDLQFESEPDYVALIYFVYNENKKYDEFKRKNLLPCTQISCRVLNVKSSIELDNCNLLFSDMEKQVMFKKVDVSFLKIKELILKAIRRKV